MSNQHLKVYGYIITSSRKIGEAYELELSHKSWLIVPRLFKEKRRDIVFGFPSFRPSVLPSPYRVCTLCAQLLLQFYSDSFETLQMFLPSFEDMHVVSI